MKSLSPAFQAHLDEGTTTLAWCWRIVRADGVSFGFTDHDRTLAFDGTDFEPESGLTASEVRSGSDLSVDAQDAEGVLTSDRITETDILDGRWDNAEVEVWRVNWSDPAQRVLMRRGAIGQIRRGRLAFVAEVRSLAHVLGQTVGRTFQATCDAALGDGRCGAAGFLHQDHAGRHVPGVELARLPGVSEVAATDGLIEFRAAGDLDAIVKAAARHTVVDVTVSRPTLEEIFVAYYSESSP